MVRSWDPNAFPNLTDDNHEITSCYDTRYNCIAWAADETAVVWWPVDGDGVGWPPEAAIDDESIWNFAVAFSTLGYVECANSSLEDGWEKVALFAVLERGELIATHAARQLEDGRWTSKLGDCEDISHTTLEAVCCKDYGVDLLYMKRRRDNKEKNNC